MYERFTDRSRRVMQLANQEAHRLNHEHIDAEHVLLGILDGSGVGANVLKNLGVNLLACMKKVRDRLTPGPDMVIMGKLPQTPRARRVIEYALEADRDTLRLNYVGTEHLLLGLVREGGGPAGEVLAEEGVTWDRVVEEIRVVVQKAKATGEHLQLTDWPAPVSVPGLPLAAPAEVKWEPRAAPLMACLSSQTTSEPLFGDKGVLLGTKVTVNSVWAIADAPPPQPPSGQTAEDAARLLDRMAEAAETPALKAAYRVAAGKVRALASGAHPGCAPEA